MKKIKLLTPFLGTTAIFATAIPLAVCSCNKNSINLMFTSPDGITVEKTSMGLNVDSTITLSVPHKKAIKETTVTVGDKDLTKDEDFSVDVNLKTITIKASAMTSKDVKVNVTATSMTGIECKKPEKVFEALSTIKASDLNVCPTFDDNFSTTDYLIYGSDYLIYDKDGIEIPDFGTTGYTFTRDDARNKSKKFIIKTTDATPYVIELTLDTTFRNEPHEIKIVDYNDFVGNGQTIMPVDLVVTVTMKDGTEKELFWGEKGYTVWTSDGTEITDFNTNGHTFNNTTTTIKNDFLLIKSQENPEVVPFKLTFNVSPFDAQVLKTCTVVSNIGEGAASITWNRTDSAPTINLSCSYDGNQWDSVQSGTAVPLAAGQSIILKGNNPQGFGTGTVGQYNAVQMTNAEQNKANVYLYGSVLGLIDNGGKEQISTLPEYCFKELFYNSAAITTVSQNFLGNKHLSKCCYQNMFISCSSLTSTPDLPATELAPACYDGMFKYCSALKNPPLLPAEDLDEYCYASMFQGCGNLVSAPKLPALVTEEHCYSSMFANCENLINPPALPATKHRENTGTAEKPVWQEKDGLASNCYMEMFIGCTHLMRAPELPAEKLDKYCYYEMFKNCTNLAYVPDLPATTLAEGCNKEMFYGCTSLEFAPKFNDVTLAISCFESMFQGCSNLKTAPLISTTEIYDSCCKNMFNGCSNLKISETGEEDHMIVFAPVTITTTDSFTDMFKDTKDGTITVEAGKTYYWAEFNK